MGEENHSTFLSFRRHDFLKLGAICPPSGYPTRHPSDSRTERVKNKTHRLLSRQQVWRIRYTELGPRQGLVCESPLPPDGPAQAHGQGPVSRETLRHHKNGHSSDDVLTPPSSCPSARGNWKTFQFESVFPHLPQGRLEGKVIVTEFLCFFPASRRAPRLVKKRVPTRFIRAHAIRTWGASVPVGDRSLQHSGI